MLSSRRTVTVGLAALGLVGVAGGGIAWAAAEANSPATAASSTTNHCAGLYGTASRTRAPMNAAATYLGLSRATLIEQMHAGQSLADIARAQNKDTDGLSAAMVAAARRSLAAHTTLTSAQRTAILTIMKSHIATMLTGSHMAGLDVDDMGQGMMGGSGNGMWSGSGNGMMGGTGNAMMGR